MSGAIRLSGVTINAPDALRLARFYATITGGVAKGGSDRATVTGPNGDIGFQQVEEFRPPEWPVGNVHMHMHLDFLVDDLASTEVRVLAAGATRCEFQPNDDHCLVYADPAGHPFCLSMWDGPRLDRDASSSDHGAAPRSDGAPLRAPMRLLC